MDTHYTAKNALTDFNIYESIMSGAGYRDFPRGFLFKTFLGWTDNQIKTHEKEYARQIHKKKRTYDHDVGKSDACTASDPCRG